MLHVSTKWPGTGTDGEVSLEPVTETLGVVLLEAGWWEPLFCYGVEGAPVEASDEMFVYGPISEKQKGVNSELHVIICKSSLSIIMVALIAASRTRSSHLLHVHRLHMCQII